MAESARVQLAVAQQPPFEAMPLVIIAGNPCSGKSSIAQELQRLLEADGKAVHLVSENALLPDRNKSYTSTPHRSRRWIACLQYDILYYGCVDFANLCTPSVCSTCGGEEYKS